MTDEHLTGDAWIVVELEAWLALAETYVAKRTDAYGNYAGRGVVGNLEVALEDRQGITQQILDRVQRGLGSRQPLIASTYRRDTRGIDVEASIERVRYAIGLVKRRQDFESALGSPAPRMRADLLHPLIWDAASEMWADGHHSAAVQRAATFLNAHVQHLLDVHDISDAGLMQQAFSSKDADAGRPRLRWPGDPSALTVRSMNEGLRGYAPGVFMTIRNPTTHGTESVPEQVSLEHLAALSLLARWIDACEVMGADN